LKIAYCKKAEPEYFEDLKRHTKHVFTGSSDLLEKSGREALIKKIRAIFPGEKRLTLIIPRVSYLCKSDIQLYRAISQFCKSNIRIQTLDHVVLPEAALHLERAGFQIRSHRIREGQKTGNPPGRPVNPAWKNPELVMRMVNAGYTTREIRYRLKASKRTLHRVMEASRNPEAPVPKTIRLSFCPPEEGDRHS